MKKWTVKEICDNFIPEHQIYPNLSESEEFVKLDDVKKAIEEARKTPADQVIEECTKPSDYENESEMINTCFDFGINTVEQKILEKEVELNE